MVQQISVNDGWSISKSYRIVGALMVLLAIIIFLLGGEIIAAWMFGGGVCFLIAGLPKMKDRTRALIGLVGLIALFLGASNAQYKKAIRQPQNQNSVPVIQYPNAPQNVPTAP